MKSWALGICLVSTLCAQGCASGNWLRFRPERFESADSGDNAVISASTYDALTKIQALSAKGQHVDALDMLSDLESAVKDVPNERALIYQAKAYVLMTMGRLHEAPPAIEKALEPGTLPEQTAQDLRYNLAQIYVQQEQFKKAAPVLELWISQTDRPEPEAVALLAYIHHQEKHYDLAARYAKQALAMRPDNIDWRQILLACQFEQKNYKGARASLMHLLSRAPTDPGHWRTLSQLDLLLEHPSDAMMSLEIAGDISQLESHEIMQLVRLSILQELPSRGARILSQALQEQRVADSAEHWSLLGHAHLGAQDFERAGKAFEQALAKMQDPKQKTDLCLRLAGLATRQGDWPLAQRHAQCAAQSPDPQTRANAQVIDGIASYQSRDFQRSLASLAAARAYPATRTTARQWEDMVRVQMHNLSTIAGADPAAKANAR